MQQHTAVTTTYPFTLPSYHSQKGGFYESVGGITTSDSSLSSTLDSSSSSFSSGTQRNSNTGLTQHPPASLYSRAYYHSQPLPTPSSSRSWQEVTSNSSSNRPVGRLPTPPSDAMNVYSNVQSNTGGSRQSNACAPIAQSQYYQPSYTTQAYPYTYSSRTTEAAKQNGQHQYDERPQEVKRVDEQRKEEQMQKKEMIHPNMQIPSSINDSGGSIAELAAQLTCLFWFEPTDTLRKAEKLSANSSPIKRLGTDAIPTGGFRKWVVSILVTTQVTPNVILLALLFIYRLKTTNPTVKGKPGSEYRLLTVALMLGNKFLDDNTYTNKTWAEVSGISVGEIHVMEVEFLSNMRYSLLASKEQWAEWQTKVGRFAEYVDRASKVPLPPPVMQCSLPSPSYSVGSQSVTGSPYPVANMSATEQNQQYSATRYNLPAPAQFPPLIRKRSLEDIVIEQAPKRVATVYNRQCPANTAMPRQSMPHLPAPNLSIPTTANMSYVNFAPSLPSFGKTMSQAFPSTPAYTPQPQMSLPPLNSAQAANLGYNTPSRRHSPCGMGVHSMNSSPVTGLFSNNVQSNSPSVYYQQRTSPYKPVMLPKTLLYPPPSSSFNHFQPHVDQMHYQPLGKRNDYRTGVVPEYRGPMAGHMGAGQYWHPMNTALRTPQYSGMNV